MIFDKIAKLFGHKSSEELAKEAVANKKQEEIWQANRQAIAKVERDQANLMHERHSRYFTEKAVAETFCQEKLAVGFHALVEEECYFISVDVIKHLYKVSWWKFRKKCMRKDSRRRERRNR